MEANNNPEPNNANAGISSSEYRTKLLTKLNCLIAVLEVAIAKISRSMDLPGSNEERLQKIRANLENTLSICNRAKGTLAKNASSTGTGTATKPRNRPPISGPKDGMSYRDYVELSSIDEYQKFKKLDPISEGELEETDIDALMRKLSES